MYGDERAIVPIEAVGSGESGARSGIYVGAGGRLEIVPLEINAKNAEGIGHEEGFFVGSESDAVGIEKFAVEF